MAPALGSQAPSSSAAAPPAPTPEAESEVILFRRQVEGLAFKADLVERRVNEVVEFHDSKRRGSGRRKAADERDGSHSRGKPDLFRQFTAILREITSHDWAKPFKEPVDVEALELDDYHQVTLIILYIVCCRS